MVLVLIEQAGGIHGAVYTLHPEAEALGNLRRPLGVIQICVKLKVQMVIGSTLLPFDTDRGVEPHSVPLLNQNFFHVHISCNHRNGFSSPVIIHIVISDTECTAQLGIPPCSHYSTYARSVNGMIRYFLALIGGNINAIMRIAPRIEIPLCFITTQHRRFLKWQSEFLHCLYLLLFYGFASIPARAPSRMVWYCFFPLYVYCRTLNGLPCCQGILRITLW